MKRKSIVITWLALLFIGIAVIFWHFDWIYSLPTPVPENYKTVDKGNYIDLPATVKSDSTKPLFLHFFNPDCPCSRFNMAHFKSLVKQYSGQVNFAIVILSNREYSQKDIQDKFGLALPVFFDSAIAATCGVYSTPQAVIIDTRHRLFYRGNYNRTRYCTDKKSAFAKMALDALLLRNQIVFDQFALKAYGCKLPNCTK